MTSATKSEKDTKPAKTDENEVIEDQNVFDGTVERKFTYVMGVMNQANSAIEIIATDVETQNPATFKIYLQKWDDELKRYVDDAEILERANEISQKAFKCDAKEIKDKNEDLFESTFEAFYDGDRASFNPIPLRIRYDKITVPDSKALKKVTEFGTVPMTEYHGTRFNAGVAVEINGEEKKFRVSQLKIESDDDDTPDRLVSLKYTNNQINQFRTQLENDSVPQGSRKHLEMAIQKLCDKEREAKIASLTEDLGVDFEKIIAGEAFIVFKEIECSQVPNSEFYFLAGTVDIEATKETVVES